MSVDYAWTYLNTSVICTVCEQPALVCHGPQWVAMCVLSSFLGLPSRQRCVLAVAPHQRDSGMDLSHTRNYLWMYSLHEIFTCAYLKFTVYGHKQTDRQTDIHTTSANAVTLVWGSLRLAPITLPTYTDIPVFVLSATELVERTWRGGRREIWGSRNTGQNVTLSQSKLTTEVGGAWG